LGGVFRHQHVSVADIAIGGDRALAEIEPVIGASVHRDEALQGFDGAEHAGDAAVTGRRIGVVRVAGEPHF